MKDANHRLPWRQPVFWLVIGLPLATIVAGVATMRYAIGSAEAIAEPVARVAQVQTANLDADARADELGLSGTLVRDGAHVRVELARAGGAAHGDSAPMLRLEHAAASAKDEIVVLTATPTASHWIGVATLEPATYRVTLAAADGSWRLRGRLTPNDARIELLPATTQ